MYWRIGTRYRAQKPEQNRDSFFRIVAQGPPPGLLAMEGERAIGWCQVTPRGEVPHLEKTRHLKAVDDAPVWSLSCFYIRKGHRRKGVTQALIEGAIAFARRQKAAALEAYPLDASEASSYSFTGYASTFERLGFVEVARREKSRPILRLSL